MHRGYGGVFQIWCFWVWSHTVSQGVDRVAQPIAALGLGCAADLLLWVCTRWQPATDPVAHPLEVSGVGTQPGLQVCVPTLALCGCAPRQLGPLSGHIPSRGFRCGPQATDWGTCPLGHFGSGTQAARPLIRAHAHLEFQLWAPSLLIWVRTRWASGESWGCFSRIHSRGSEGGVASEATAAAESSLTSH